MTKKAIQILPASDTTAPAPAPTRTTPTPAPTTASGPSTAPKPTSAPSAHPWLVDPELFPGVCHHEHRAADHDNVSVVFCSVPGARRLQDSIPAKSQGAATNNKASETRVRKRVAGRGGEREKKQSEREPGKGNERGRQNRHASSHETSGCIDSQTPKSYSCMPCDCSWIGWTYRLISHCSFDRQPEQKVSDLRCSELRAA